MKKETILHILAKLLDSNVWNRRAKCSQPGKQLFPAWETNVPSVGARPCRFARRRIKNSPKGYFLHSLILLLMLMTVGVGNVWGQVGTDYSGTYYIKNVSVNKETSDDYYLCPTEGWIYYEETNSFTEDPNGQPFLTTYPCKSTEGYNANKALWKIEKSGDYYTIKNVFHDKYIVYNGQISDANVGRIRVHLEDVETPTQNGNELFVISTNASNIVISPKNESTNYFNVCQGNINDLAGSTKWIARSKNDGPTTPTVHKSDIHGTIGLYNGITDSNAQLLLEDYINRPEISYTSGNSVTITYPTSATIYYTTDGSDPTSSSTRQDFTGTSQTVSFTDVAVVKAAAYISGVYSNIATYVYVHTGSGNPYLLQSVANTSFYMLAGDARNASTTTVNTSSLPQAGMSWHFEDAGIVNGVQCYYIYNTSVTGYLRRDGNNFYIQTAKENKNDYKFAVIPYLNESGNLGGFYLYNIGKTQYVYKANNGTVVGNGSDGAVNLNSLTAIANQDLARWNLILVANKSFPSPVTLSDNTSATYYTFASSNTLAQLITTPTGTSAYVKTSNGENDNQKWYFKDAGTDGWASYYYILNAVTGEAVYFGKDAASATISDALEMRALPETPTDNYKFALAHTVTDGEYYIVPKPLAQFTKTKYTAVWYVSSSLQTQSNRADSKIKWQISEVENFIPAPYISYVEATNTATISCTYPGATIYYTTDGLEATTSSTNTVSPVDPSPTASTSFVLDAGISTIRAIVSEGISSSSESTYNIKFQLTLTDAAADLRPYIIQSQSNVNFYMIPGDDVGEDPNKITKVNTTTLFRPTMEWCFKNAGVEDGIQYYYIVNRGNNKNLCYDTENTAYGVYMETNSDNSNKFKFQIKVSSTAGTYNIIPYGLTTGNMYLNKSGGNEGVAALILYSDATQGSSRWKFVPSADLDKTAPFEVPDASSTPYYNIASVGSSGYYIVPPSGTATNATTSSSTDAETNWYFEVAQAASDADWCNYYHLRNVLTGEYLYFAKDDNNAGACLEMKSTIEGEEDRYMFTWARTATANTYYIVPKLLKDKSLNQISSLQRNGGTLQSNLTRGAGNLAWTFNPSYYCLDPTIVYVPGTETGAVEMTCATKPSKIYYTTDGSDPASSSSTRTEYNSENKPSYTDVAQIYIKAIAVLDNSEHEAASDIITFIKNPTVTFDPGYDYEYNNEAKEPPVTSVTVGTDNTVIDASEYDVTYGTDVNVGSVPVTISDKVDNNLIISGVASFDITPRSLGDGTTASDGVLITVTKTPAEGDTYTYSVSVKNGSLTLVEGTDYTLTDVTIDASGYRATVTAKVPGNYEGGAKIIYVSVNFPTKTSLTDGGSAAVYQASIDLAYPSDMKAYIVTDIDYAAETVTVQELAYIPNGVPVLLLTNDGSGHDADFTASAYNVVQAADVSANLLKKSVGGESVDWGQYFIFSRGEFVLSMGEKTMKAEKFYLVNEKYSSTSAPARLYIRRRSSSTKISEVESLDTETSTTSIWYTLDGQKLSKKPTRKGIYINKGNKIVVR